MDDVCKDYDRPAQYIKKIKTKKNPLYKKKSVLITFTNVHVY